MPKHDYNTLKRTALNKLFDNLNDMQREAVFSVNGPVLILAGAGSGKTTVIVNRIANMVYFGNAYNEESTRQHTDEEMAFIGDFIDGKVDDKQRLRDIICECPINPWNILAITFTNKAAKELKQRLSTLLGEDEGGRINAATFHSACVRILRREIEALGYDKSFTIYDSDDSQRIVKACLLEMNLSDKTFPTKSILREISSAKDKLLSPEEMIKDSEGDYRRTVYSKVYAAYQKRLKASNAVDFDDIIKLTVELFESNPEVLNHYRNLYKYVMVDEYQDTNQAQYRLVSLLSGGHKNLCVVGDDDQSIYKFRGATIENILSFEEQFTNSKVIRLEQNYRSTQTILDAANGVIKNNLGRKSKALWTASGTGEKIVVYKAQDEHDEANFIAKTISDKQSSGISYGSNTVLYRMNAQSNIIERAFAHHSIPYMVLGGLKFYDRKEIKDIVAYLSVINNSSDNLRLKRIINEPKRGIGDSTLGVIEEIANDLSLPLLEVMRNSDSYPLLSKKCVTLKALVKMFDYLKKKASELPLAEFLDVLVDKTSYGTYMQSLGDEGVTRLQNINELKSSMLEYSNSSEEPTLSGFLEEISLYTDVEKLNDNDDCVILMTIHSAKGLEFDNVFIAGMEDGIFPSMRSASQEDELEEERRLAYVAITRAKKNLYITNASQRMLFGVTNRNFPSRFIKEIDSDLLDKQDNTVIARGVERPTVSSIQSISLQDQLKKKIANKSNNVQTEYTVGQRVYHNIFKDGTILSVTPMANDTMLEIGFEKVGTKKIMANFAKLKFV